MKCTPCGQKAVIHLPAYRLRLCKTCYPAWFEKYTQRTIERLKMFTRSDRILVAVSGGKDSLGLWHALLKLGYEAEGFYIHLRIQAEPRGEVSTPPYLYSEESMEFAQAFADKAGKRLHVVDLKETLGNGIPEIRKATRRPACSSCGTIKRHYMNQVALDGGYPVMATGHNLDDEVATLFSNTLRWDMDYLSRQDPVLPAGEGFVRKVKPFCFFSEKETALYARIEGIPYVYEECPFSVGATSLHMKDVINRLEHDSPGTKRTFFANFLKAKDRLVPTPKPVMEPCASCGAMTPSQLISPSPKQREGGAAMTPSRIPSAPGGQAEPAAPEATTEGAPAAERRSGDGPLTPGRLCAFCRIQAVARRKDSARPDTFSKLHDHEPPSAGGHAPA